MFDYDYAFCDCKECPRKECRRHFCRIPTGEIVSIGSLSSGDFAACKMYWPVSRQEDG